MSIVTTRKIHKDKMRYKPNKLLEYRLTEGYKKIQINKYNISYVSRTLVKNPLHTTPPPRITSIRSFIHPYLHHYK